MRASVIVNITALMLTACNNDAQTQTNAYATPVIDSAGDATSDRPKTHLGECILLEPARATPTDPYLNTGVIATSDYPPFTKMVLVNGLTLIAGDDITDEFLDLVTQTTVEMFPQDERLDLDLQRQVLENNYRYNAVIPVPRADNLESLDPEKPELQALFKQNSVCDIIMEGSSGQVMEVVEHILHYLNDIGLHYTFPEEWGISKKSALYNAMQKAITKGFYDVSSYKEDGIEDPETYNRVIMQEFGYWFISTAWNLQEPYGPVWEAEWTIKNREELQSKLPEFFEIYENTVERVMVAPSLETLQKIGPLRSQEQNN